MNWKKIAPLLIYLFINFIFIIKYVSRIDNINQYLIGLFYIIVILILTILYRKIKINHNYYKYLFFFIVIAFFGFTVFLNIHVNGLTLNVDRWSAMENAIKALFNGDYIYSARDHLNGRTSNLPTLVFIGIPFYLIGNIGLLQSFAFLLFSYILFMVNKDYKKRLFGLLFLIMSPAYLWEIYVKSDLMTNFIILLLFLVICYKKQTKNNPIKTVPLSFFSTALLLTRLTTIIPLTLLLFKRFWNSKFNKKLIFCLISIITMGVFLYICFYNTPSYQYFIKYNPFSLQNRQLPFIVSLITILIPIFFSFKITTLEVLLQKSTLFLLIPIFIAFILFISDVGWYSSIYNSVFDISYLNMVLPFVLILISFNLNTPIIHNQSKISSR